MEVRKSHGKLPTFTWNWLLHQALESSLESAASGPITPHLKPCVSPARPCGLSSILLFRVQGLGDIGFSNCGLGGGASKAGPHFVRTNTGPTYFIEFGVSESLRLHHAGAQENKPDPKT